MTLHDCQYKNDISEIKVDVKTVLELIRGNPAKKERGMWTDLEDVKTRLSEMKYKRNKVASWVYGILGSIIGGVFSAVIIIRFIGK